MKPDFSLIHLRCISSSRINQDRVLEEDKSCIIRVPQRTREMDHLRYHKLYGQSVSVRGVDKLDQRTYFT